MAPKDERAQCELPPGLSTREANNATHKIKLIDGKTTSIMYRRDDAKDASDSKVLSVWSQEW
jgi:hypothetical protein